MQFNEHDFYNCPYCKSAKDEETSSKISDRKRYLKMRYTCGTEIEIEWDGEDCVSSWDIACVPETSIN